MNTASASPVLLTVEQLATRWQIEPDELRADFLKPRKIPHIRLSERRIRIPLADVEAYELAHRIGKAGEQASS